MVLPVENDLLVITPAKRMELTIFFLKMLNNLQMDKLMSGLGEKISNNIKASRLN